MPAQTVNNGRSNSQEVEAEVGEQGTSEAEDVQDQTQRALRSPENAEGGNGRRQGRGAFRDVEADGGDSRPSATASAVMQKPSRAWRRPPGQSRLPWRPFHPLGRAVCRTTGLPNIGMEPRPLLA